MNIQITGRHVQVTDALRDYLTSKLQPMLAENRQIESAHAVLDVQRRGHIVEIVVQMQRQANIKAKGQSDDMYKSMDIVLDKIYRQLKRARAKVIDHKTPKRRVKLSDFERQIQRSTDEE